MHLKMFIAAILPTLAFGVQDLVSPCAHRWVAAPFVHRELCPPRPLMLLGLLTFPAPTLQAGITPVPIHVEPHPGSRTLPKHIIHATTDTSANSCVTRSQSGTLLKAAEMLSDCETAVLRVPASGDEASHKSCRITSKTGTLDDTTLLQAEASAAIAAILTQCTAPGDIGGTATVDGGTKFHSYYSPPGNF